MKPKLSRRLRSRHRYSVLLAQETTHRHSLCSVVVEVCTRIRKGHWTASRRLLRDDTGHQVIRHAQRQKRVGTATLNMCEMVLTTRNPKQSQSWRTGNSLLESKTEAIPNVSARKWARGPSKSSLSRKDCPKKQRTGRPSTTGRSKSFDSRQEKCKEAKQTRVQQTGHDALFIMSCLMDTVQANKPRKFNPQTSSSDVSLLLLLETLPWLDCSSQPWKTPPQFKKASTTCLCTSLLCLLSVMTKRVQQTGHDEKFTTELRSGPRKS